MESYEIKKKYFKRLQVFDRSLCQHLFKYRHNYAFLFCHSEKELPFVYDTILSIIVPWLGQVDDEFTVMVTRYACLTWQIT